MDSNGYYLSGAKEAGCLGDCASRRITAGAASKIKMLCLHSRCASAQFLCLRVSFAQDMQYARRARLFVCLNDCNITIAIVVTALVTPSSVHNKDSSSILYFGIRSSGMLRVGRVHRSKSGQRGVVCRP